MVKSRRSIRPIPRTIDFQYNLRHFAPRVHIKNAIELSLPVVEEHLRQIGCGIVIGTQRAGGDLHDTLVDLVTPGEMTISGE